MPGLVVHRTKHSEQYVIVPNYITRDRQLSFRARGLLAYLLSLPNGWHLSTDELAKANPDSRKGTRDAMRELREAGYVLVKTERGSDGRTRRRLEVFDVAQPSAIRPAFGVTSTDDVFPQVAPNAAKPNADRVALNRSTGEEDGLKDGGSPSQSRRDREITTDRESADLSIHPPSKASLHGQLSHARARDNVRWIDPRILAAQQAEESRRRREASEQWQALGTGTHG